MENDARQILKNVVTDFGRKVLEEPDRLAGLLADYQVPRREAEAIVYASRTGVAAELRARAANGQPVSADDLASRLNVAVDPELSGSTLDAIAFSLGATIARGAPAAHRDAAAEASSPQKMAREPQPEPPAGKKKKVWKRAGLALAAKLAGVGALAAALATGALIYERDWATGIEAPLKSGVVTPDEHDFDILDQLVFRQRNPNWDDPQVKSVLTRQLSIGDNTRVLVIDRPAGSDKAEVRILDGPNQGKTGWVLSDETTHGWPVEWVPIAGWTAICLLALSGLLTIFGRKSSWG